MPLQFNNNQKHFPDNSNLASFRRILTFTKTTYFRAWLVSTLTNNCVCLVTVYSRGLFPNVCRAHGEDSSRLAVLQITLLKVSPDIHSGTRDYAIADNYTPAQRSRLGGWWVGLGTGVYWIHLVIFLAKLFWYNKRSTSYVVSRGAK